MTMRASTHWTYATIRVMDGDRRIQPTHVSFDHLLFSEPPKLSADRVEIIVTNGDAAQRGWATVLPHDPLATRIPIRLDRPASEGTSQ